MAQPMSTAITVSDLRRPPTVSIWVAATVGPLMIVAALPTFGHSAQTLGGRIGPVLLGGGLLVTALSIAVAGVLLVLWCSRARAFASGRSGRRPRLSPALSTMSWFIPIGNLWLPAVAMRDLVELAVDSDATVGGRLWGWWMCWVGSWIVLLVGIVSFASHPDGMAGLLAVTLFLFTALLFAAGAFLTGLLRRIVRSLTPDTVI
ncbi:DUF4328 domain-containing protein [Nocardia veterana]|uniref:DUF4328 domain-containing protein n=1 Tax=Nocardia veterana TaxID=132249 RepID=A0A7X6M5U4_9NOCA|nr:DUF4328 domain-containing protein [Nocardia veterana]NKY89742.1 DUF4328 domain-containing protein [Nocardia veterana]